MKIDRQKVHAKHNGLCAYTGRPLEHDWQVDHVRSKNAWKYYIAGECAQMKSYEQRDARLKEVDNIENLLPALRIVNHYKRSLDLEGFRDYMLTFHLRLQKLPKTTNREKTKERIIYMNKIAELFGIEIDKPFDGKFYFERME
ncbi:MAG TPA: hypothetical protein VFC36_04155 [Paludibacter sp.]|nr:hypothetical protein [Paludibacter sp.]